MTDVKHTLRGREDCSLNFFLNPPFMLEDPENF